MRRPLLLYIPSGLLLIAAIIFPQMGRDFVGKMNASEFSLFLAFWTLILAIAVRVLYRMIAGSYSNRPVPRGFDVIQGTLRSPAAEEPADAVDRPASR